MSTLTITGIQTKLYWEDKKANLEMLEKKILSLSQPTQIVVLPEMFSTGFSMNPETLAETMEGTTIQWMKNLSREKKIILTGSVIIEGKNDGSDKLPSYYNRLIWMLPNGQFGYYDKRHLFAYGDEHNHYQAGSKRLIASVNGWKINLQVCYDLRFPVWARQAPPSLAENKEGEEAEFDVLIYVANWPERRIIAWRTLLQARAIENQCYLVGVNRVGEDGNNNLYSGESMVVDPLGEILYHKKDAEDIFTVTIDKSRLQAVRKKFPFWRDADEFAINL